MPKIVGYLIDDFGDIVETKEEREERIKRRTGDTSNFNIQWGCDGWSITNKEVLAFFDAIQTNMNKDKE